MTHKTDPMERCRALFRNAGIAMISAGVDPVDVAIAASYAAHDASQHTGRNPHDAIEWLRTALDLQERQLLEQARA